MNSLKEPIRFAITGVASTLTSYAGYYLFLSFAPPSIAFFLGYVAAVIVNYLLTTSFTFKVKATKKNGIGFVATNIVNFLLNEVFLMFFIFIGIDERWAPIPMYAVCVPINFLLVRFVMKKL